MSDLDAMRLLLPRLLEDLPLRDPVRADSWAVGFHLDVQGVELAFQRLGPAVELKLRKAPGEDGLDLFQRMRLEQVQHHGIGNDELAVNRFGLAGQPLRDHGQVDIGRGGDDREADQVLTPPAGTAGELLDFADRELGEVSGLADARLGEHHRAGRKIHAGGQRGGGEHGVQTSLAHQLLDGDFP